MMQGCDSFVALIPGDSFLPIVYFHQHQLQSSACGKCIFAVKPIAYTVLRDHFIIKTQDNCYAQLFQGSA